LHLDRWTEQDTRWLSVDQWNKCQGYEELAKSEKLDAMALRLRILERLAGRRCIGALDLSSKVDLTCYLKLFFPTDEDPLWIIIPEFYVPGDNVADRVSKDRVPYDVWIREGFINATPGNVIDYDFIKAKVVADASLYQLEELAFDPWNATQLANQLTKEGLTMVEFRQGYASMSEPTKNLETLVLGRKFAHLGNPVLRWNVSNLVIKEDEAGNIKPNKSRKTEKIDGAVALIMALGRAQFAGDDDGKSTYDTQGVLVL
jgi:phage terminase large subunit-like protein